MHVHTHYDNVSHELNCQPDSAILPYVYYLNHQRINNMSINIETFLLFFLLIDTTCFSSFMLAKLCWQKQYNQILINSKYYDAESSESYSIDINIRHSNLFSMLKLYCFYCVRAHVCNLIYNKDDFDSKALQECLIHNDIILVYFCTEAVIWAHLFGLLFSCF